MKRRKRRRVLSQHGELRMDRRCSQDEFALAVGETQQNISKLLTYGVLPADGNFKEWNRAYLRFLLGQIFARRGWDGLRAAMGG